eukprot:2813903-Pleurochrysis_carterae.AAC.2
MVQITRIFSDAASTVKTTNRSVLNNPAVLETMDEGLSLTRFERMILNSALIGIATSQLHPSSYPIAHPLASLPAHTRVFARARRLLRCRPCVPSVRRYVCANQRQTWASCALGMGCCHTSDYPSAELPSRVALLRWANIGAVRSPPLPPRRNIIASSSPCHA